MKYLSKEDPIYANYKLYFTEEKAEIIEEELDFKTKASLKSKMSAVHNVKEVRQNMNDGSTL